VITTVLTTTNALYISGILTGTANSSYTAEFFANTTCDASGHGEGQTFLISRTVTTDDSGQVAFSVVSRRLAGTNVTATATDSGGNTSEFSTCAMPSGQAQPGLKIKKMVTTTGDPVRPGDPVTYTIVASNTGIADATGVIIRDDLPAGLNGSSLLTTTNITAGTTLTYTLKGTVLNIPANYTATLTNTVNLSHTSARLSATVVFTTISDHVAPAARQS
jgi:uncharacterized repeat protein (TIGR01451 family)